jgi:hypothetical protein
MTKMKDVVKGVAKQSAPPSKGNVDPSDPWSATGAGGGLAIPENVTSRRADLLSKFYKAKGYNINYVSKNKRVGQSKTGEFEKWKQDHGIYEDEEVVNEISDTTAKNYMKGALHDTITGKKDRNAGLSKAISRLAGNNKPLLDAPKMKTEDNINDPQCATQSPFDGANTTNDVAPKKSKAAKMVKEIYAKHRLKEDLYDHEKDDKGPGTNVKPPKVIKKQEVNDDNEKGTNARMVLKGGTTLTGEKRDTIEIDPMMKNRGKQPDYIATNTGKKSIQ